MRTVQVAAGIIWLNKSFLVAKRPEGRTGAGFWEFPGGKREEGESMAETLRRELREELGISVPLDAITPWRVLIHDHPDQRLELHFMQVAAFSGTPHPREGQELCWVMPAEACAMPFLPADVDILSELRNEPA